MGLNNLQKDSEELEVCRLCEQKVSKEKFEITRIFCLIGNQCAITVSSIDDKLLQAYLIIF